MTVDTVVETDAATAASPSQLVASLRATGAAPGSLATAKPDAELVAVAGIVSGAVAEHSPVLGPGSDAMPVP